MEQSETPKHAVVFYGVRKELGVTWDEYILCDMVYHLSHRTGYCYKSAENIGEDMGLDKRQVQYIMQKAISKGLMERVTAHTIRVTDKYVYAAVIHKKEQVQKFSTSKDASEPTSVKSTNNLYSGTKNLYEVQKFGYKVQKFGEITEGKNNKKNNKYSGVQIEQTFNALARIIQPKARWSAGYKKLAEKALASFTTDELLVAATYFVSQFQVEGSWHNEHTQYRTLGQFLGNDKNHMPRYQTCLERSQEQQPGSTEQAQPSLPLSADDAEQKRAELRERRQKLAAERLAEQQRKEGTQ